jgi:hypothetical protein
MITAGFWSLSISMNFTLNLQKWIVQRFLQSAVAHGRQTERRQARHIGRDAALRRPVSAAR